MRYLLLAVAGVAACAPADQPDAGMIDSGVPAEPVAAITATMYDTAGVEIGILTLTQADSGIALSGTVLGLTPGEHGIHLHTVGTCAPDFDAAGGHWNPTDRQHGRDNPAGPHAGDMLNLMVDSTGTAAVALTTAGGALRGDDGLLDDDGATVVIHQDADDMQTDPSGNSGSRIACGVVQ